MSSRDPDSPESTLERIINERRGKASALRAQGADPYRNDVGPTTSLAAVRAKYAATKPAPPSPDAPPAEKGPPTPIDGETLRVAGRVMNKRGSKKMLFAPIRDATGDIQLYLNIEHLAPEE